MGTDSRTGQEKFCSNGAQVFQVYYPSQKNNESKTNNRSRDVLQQPSGSGAFCPNIWEIVPCKAGSCIGSFLFYTYSEFLGSVLLNIVMVQDPGTVNASRTGSHVCWGNTWASRTGTHRATASGVAKNWTTATCSPGSSLGRSASAGMRHLLTTPWWTRASVIGSVRGTTNSFAERCGG